MEKYKNLEEIIKLCIDDLDKDDNNVTAILNLTDLKELRHLLARVKQLEALQQSCPAMPTTGVVCEFKNKVKELEVITNGIKVLETNGVNDDTFYVIAKTDFLKGSYKHLLDDYIPKSKVEKIIKELKTEKNKHTDYYFNIQEVIRILSRLLESGD